MAPFNYLALASDLSILVGRFVSIDDARAVKRDIARHHSLAEAACNGELTPRQVSAEAGVEGRLRAFFGSRLARFEGDPRGATVKLVSRTVGEACTDGPLAYFSNDWGGNLIFTG